MYFHVHMQYTCMLVVVQFFRCIHVVVCVLCYGSLVGSRPVECRHQSGMWLVVCRYVRQNSLCASEHY